VPVGTSGTGHCDCTDIGGAVDVECTGQ
jgi:hypothetical protein